ncbi:TRAP transporter small permease [Microbaculum marinisediminis]|uniref:TRAP transporter small permease protein n=1 Tax=Microbaculum marinisediminis TaxID=2931392 RepID=A0AAW5QY99_9HYPH|nr:TRAP transporter small permease subunit [Microbaculum sp. A6E488]MCT8971383.1 TRAP transporter small permease subunit [Microbaculum sp. A6E488]
MIAAAKDFAGKCDRAFLRLSVAAFVLLAFLQITTRYFFNAPLQWTEEVAVIVLTWMTYVGAWVLLRTDSHVRLEIVDSVLPARAVRVVHLVCDVVVLATLLVVIYAGFQLLPNLVYDKTPALQLSYAVVFSIIPISCVVMAVQTTAKIVSTLSGRR